MADTIGDLLFRVSKTPLGAGVDQDLLYGIANERYFEILRHANWSRLIVDSILQTTAVYEDGTVDITAGSTTVTGNSTTFTTGMTGRSFRVTGRNEIYSFTYVGATSGTLDRAYEGDAVDDGSYKIFQNIYSLPSNCGEVKSLRVYEENDDLDELDRESLDDADPARLTFGPPQAYVKFEDDTSTPPVQQIELWPIPETSVGMPLRYQKTVSRFTAASDYVLPWVSSECLVAGILAELGGNDPGREARFQMLLGAMLREETRRGVPTQIKMAERFTEHRAQRVESSREWRRRNQMP